VEDPVTDKPISTTHGSAPWAYDNAGRIFASNRIAKARDAGSDGSIDYLTTHIVDANDRLLETTTNLYIARRF